MAKIKVIITCLLLILTTSGKSQVDDFKKITHQFKNALKHQFKLPLIYKDDDDFIVELAPISLLLEEKKITLKSPIPNGERPISFTVIYEENLVSLFEKGNFVCYQLSDFARNKDLEKVLNTKKMEYHWVTKDKIYGLYKEKIWFLNQLNNWQLVEADLPLNHQVKLYEDTAYLCYSGCRGEWGGTIYFYNKSNGNTYFTEATCANSIVKTKEGYQVLSHLRHMSGHSDLQLIENPEKLTNLKDLQLKDKRITIGSMDTSNHAKTISDFYSISIFSSFKWNDKTHYVVSWKGSTFLAEINGNHIKIVDPLFNSDLIASRPITTQYNDSTVLINLGYYRSTDKEELFMILIKDNQVIRIHWNTKY